MLKNLCLYFSLFFSINVMASSEYIGNGLVETAIRNALNDATAGVGTKSSSCLLCHNSSSGGPGNIASTGFGADFRETAQRVVNSSNGAELSLTELEAIFADTTFLELDSDNDNDDNETEFRADSDPADNSADTGGNSSGDSGGCGFIGPTGGSNTPKGPFLMILPLLMLVLLRRDLLKAR